MARFLVATRHTALLDFAGGKIKANINPLQIRTTAATGMKRPAMQDLAVALKMVCKHAGKINNVNVPYSGTKIDPDESPNGATFQVFPKDDRYKITFERDQHGHVKAVVPAFYFTDIPSAAQAAYVCQKVADLMASYEKA
ncbi:MAG: hypothetical protein IPL32_18140 [Chloracidobacterium sp.]|nr:hypothetical protein [Chloracidobacterium sp.]